MSAATASRPPPAAPAGPAAIAAAGLLSLAVAMGIGRFAFTPILPMMLHDGVIDIAGASWLASANYLGYLAGALFCTLHPWLAARLPWPPARIETTRWIRAGLASTALLTLGMAMPWPALWPPLRFAAGAMSAVTLVHTSSWCFAQLAARGRPALGGLVFAGPGAGIFASGFVAGGVGWLGGSSAAGWCAFGVLAAVLAAAAWPTFASAHEHAVPAVAELPPGVPVLAAHGLRSGTAELAVLTAAYGLAGFGYIVTATFLPVIARAALPESAWTAMFWPVFGLGAVMGAVGITRLAPIADQRGRLVVAYATQAAGISLGIVWPTLPGFALGSFLVGLPFTTITFFALQEVRQLRPERAASAFGLLTAVYGVGQVVGPPLVSALVHAQRDAGVGFRQALWIAAAVLTAGAGLYLIARQRWPRGQPARTA